LGLITGLCFLNIGIKLSDLMIFIAVYCQADIRGPERKQTNKQKQIRKTLKPKPEELNLFGKLIISYLPFGVFRM